MNQLRHNLATLAKNKKNQQENSRTLWQQWLQSTDCKNMDELNACVQEIQAYSEKFSRQSQQLLQNLPKFMQLLQKESVLEQELQTLQEALGEVLEIGDIELEELGSSEYLDENTATHYNRFFRQMIALENRESAMNSHAIVSTADIYGNIIYANDLFCEINGMAREELLGKNHRIVASGVHPRSFFTQMWETISQGETWHGEICNRTPAGKMYWVAATIMPFMGKDGLPEKYISVRTEITAQKNLELQLAQERLS